MKAAIVLIALVMIAGCGATPPPSNTPVPTPVPTPTAGIPNPNTQIWPTDVISATIALAAMDNEVKKAGDDLTKAADTADLVLLLGAAEGLAKLAGDSIPNARILIGWADTKAVGDAYLPALTAIQVSAQGLATAVRGNDPAGVTSNSQSLGQAIGLYAKARPLIVDVADKALEMQKHLLR